MTVTKDVTVRKTHTTYEGPSFFVNYKKNQRPEVQVFEKAVAQTTLAVSYQNSLTEKPIDDWAKRHAITAIFFTFVIPLIPILRAIGGVYDHFHAHSLDLNQKIFSSIEDGFQDKLRESKDTILEKFTKDAARNLQRIKGTGSLLQKALQNLKSKMRTMNDDAFKSYLLKNKLASAAQIEELRFLQAIRNTLETTTKIGTTNQTPLGSPEDIVAADIVAAMVKHELKTTIIPDFYDEVVSTFNGDHLKAQQFLDLAFQDGVAPFTEKEVIMRNAAGLSLSSEKSTQLQIDLNSKTIIIIHERTSTSELENPSTIKVEIVFGRSATMGLKL